MTRMADQITDAKPHDFEPDCSCQKCGHAWFARTRKPVQCPRCKTYKWEAPNA